MNYMNYLVMFVAGAIGILVYTLRKIKGIRKRSPELTFKTTFKNYWLSDWDTVTLSLVVVLGCIFISSEYLKAQTLPPGTDPLTFPVTFSYKVANFIRTTFVVIGYCATSIVDVFLGTTESNLQKKADAVNNGMQG